MLFKSPLLKSLEKNDKNMLNWFLRIPFRFKVAKLLLNYDNDNWKYVSTKYSPFYFGAKCEKDFSNYFTGVLASKETTPEESVSWLKSCTCVKNNNNWKHPSEFERTMTGDCKDYCLWLWRNLVENDYDAYFVSGERLRDGEYFQHAWVILNINNKTHIIDPLTIYENEILEIEGNKENYIPWLSVSNKFSCFLYNGYIRGTTEASNK